MNIDLAGGAVTYQPNDEQLSRVSLEFAAFDGEVGTGQLPVPDISAAINVAGGRAAMVEEGATLLTDGFIIDHARERGPIPVGTAREYVFSVMDANALLGGFRVTRSRPSETDYARVMAFAGIDGPSWDTTFVLNASTVTMPQKKYDTAGGWDELISDVTEFTGKTLFLHDKAAGGRCLHYHTLTNGHTCGLTISDVIAAVDSVTTYFPQNPSRQRTSVDLVNDVKGRDQAGRTHTSTDSTSITDHDADGLQHQALIDFDTTGQADLNVKTAAFLASQKDERDTWTCAIGPLDEDALALIRVGDLISVTSSVMGLSGSQRIAHMTLTPIIGQGGRVGTGWWLATLELGAPVRRRARVKAGPALARAVAPYLPTPWDYTVCRPMHDTFTRTVAAGSLGTSELNGSDWASLISGSALSVNGTEARMQPVGNTTIGGTVSTAARIVLSLTYPIHFRALAELTGSTQASTTSMVYYLGDKDRGAAANGHGVWQIALEYSAGGSPVLVLDVSNSADGGGGGGGTSSPIGSTDPISQFVWVEAIITATDMQVRAWLDGGSAPAYTDYPSSGTTFLPDRFEMVAIVGGNVPAWTPDWRVTLVEFLCDDPGPTTGQQIRDEYVFTGDGIRSTATLQYPYAPGTLTITVDGTEQDVTQTDPTTGAMALTFTPAVGEVVRASYQRGPQ